MEIPPARSKDPRGLGIALAVVSVTMNNDARVSGGKRKQKHIPAEERATSSSYNRLQPPSQSQSLRWYFGLAGGGRRRLCRMVY